MLAPARWTEGCYVPNLPCSRQGIVEDRWTKDGPLPFHQDPKLPGSSFLLHATLPGRESGEKGGGWGSGQPSTNSRDRTTENEGSTSEMETVIRDMSIGLGCYNKHHRPGGAETTQIYFLTVLQARNLRSGTCPVNSGENSPPRLQMGTFLLFFHTAEGNNKLSGVSSIKRHCPIMKAPLS